MPDPGEMLSATASTLQVVFLGYVLAVLPVSLVVSALTLTPTALKAITFGVDAIRPVSAIALYPLIVHWFGIGLEARVVVIAWAVWPVIFVAVAHALAVTSPGVLDAAKLDAGVFQILLRVRWPLAAKSVGAALVATVGTAWIGVTAAEMLGGTDGLGYQILRYAQAFQFANVSAYIGAVALLGFLQGQGFRLIYSAMENHE